MAVSIENRVKKAITNYKRGKIFFPSDFSKLGSSTAIRKALNRLENDTFLLRIAHGVYLYPKEHPSFGILYPSTEQIAKAIAKRDKARIIPTGIQALNKLGLSTQVPMNIVYLTDGSARSINVNNGSIKFKKASPKLLSVKSNSIILIIQALKELEEKNVNSKIKERIKQILQTEDKDIITHDIKLAPQWIAKIIKELIAL
ncbi:hypothetical protein Aeqsu_3103 [Aequorivita sublithincola DSM 14238]|uniref:Uncharacterized protein n=1 Tax=Aequorivita sublithincola (strain DSM 14238 / LMG 21431 / ACAM 643 / 9-3) TaxID=746697 RepID=I3YZX0_AEQSU|nr:DUF6088 family protein [Aequorivita sublithincola]AFL82538.1 hypothetical protein Aeqsu_3103 [Aequorivita sublithincola DSM 14238]